MMKTFLRSAILLLALTETAAAADLLARKEPVVPPPPALSWSGFHFGVNAGGTWTNNNSVNVATVPLYGGDYWMTASALSGSLNTGNGGGFIGGGQIGYDWQTNLSNLAFVIGFETDIQGIAGSSGNGQSAVSNVPFDLTFGPFEVPGTLLSAANASKSLSYIGTARGRIGFLAMPNLLVYGTGGLAYGQAKLSTSLFQHVHANNGRTRISLDSDALGGSNISNTLVGWTVGGGVE